MPEYYNVTTNVGDAAIATAIANNSKLNITHIAFGDGNGSVPTPTKTRTSLVREVHRQAITKYAMHPTIANYIVIETIIPSNIGGFWIREMGIIADNVLISHGSHAPFFKVADPDSVSEYRLKFTQNVRDGNVVEISLDESLIYASQAWVNENYIRRNELVDNLTTDDAKKPVSAKQAKNLQDNKLDKTANAVSSSKLETARTVSFSGAATGSFNFDGSGNSSCVLALANSGVVASTYGAALKIPIITVNAKGLITGVSEQNIPIVDNLTTNDATKPVSAKQAKILNDGKLNISDVVDNLTSTFVNKPLSANLGRHLNEAKVERLNNLSDLNSIDAARQNLKINRVGQLVGESNLMSPNSALKLIVSDSVWGCYDITNNTTKELTIPYGGTGAKTAEEACSNLNLDALLFSPIPHPSSVPPSGYLAMQGQTISAATYPKLYALYGATLPDLRGEFIRGWDNGRGADSGRSLRTSQGDAIRNITGEFQQPPPVGSTKYAGGAFSIIRITENTNGGGSSTQKDLIYFDASRVVPTASENRPRNIAFNYIVKAG